jgi:transposase
MSDAERDARIRRLYAVEHWSVGTICAQLGVHHEVVRRVLKLDTRAASAADKQHRPWAVEPYLPFVVETLKTYPTLTATRLHAMIRARGYAGGATQLRRAIVAHGLRPRPARQAYTSRVHLPGEEAQVDWAYLDPIRVGRVQRRVYALLVVLTYSGDYWVGFYHDMTASTLLAAHVEAFTALGGVPRRVLYDNMKTAVLEREGDEVRYHPSLLALADHYGFEPLACRPYRPNEKGSVERRVRDLRSSFLAATSFGTLPEFRTAFDTWRSTVLGPRIADPATRQTVAERAAHERTLLRPLPQNVFGEWPVKPVVIGKQPWVTVDTNRYSVPHTLVGRTLSLLVTHDRVCLLDGTLLVAHHVRTWDKHTQVDDPEHVAALRTEKKRANEQDGRQRLVQSCPHAEELLARLVQYGERTGSHTRKLNELVERYGPDKVDNAIQLAMERGTLLASSVQFLLVDNEPSPTTPEGPPSIPVILPDRADVREQHFNTHPLKDYDVCTTAPDNRHR